MGGRIQPRSWAQRRYLEGRGTVAAACLMAVRFPCIYRVSVTRGGVMTAQAGLDHIAGSVPVSTERGAAGDEVGLRCEAVH
jgi:hypothetical protein